VAHLVSEDEIDAELEERIEHRVREEERERIREEEIRHRNLVADFKERYLRRNLVLPEQQEPVNTEQWTFCENAVRRRRSILIYVSVCVIVLATVAIALGFTLQEETVPKRKLSLECQEKCKGLLTGSPVLVNDREFQQAILEYLKDRSSSPYGPDMNCWDVSRVRFKRMMIISSSLIFCLTVSPFVLKLLPFFHYCLIFCFCAGDGHVLCILLLQWI
jgi:hypothetical protein